MEYQLYELLLFFALYSILGWAADRCIFALRRRKGGRGLCKGPYMPAFGAAALLLISWSESAAREVAAWLGTDLNMDLPAAALCGMASGAVCAFVVAVLVRLASGKSLVHVSFSDVLMWMTGGILVIMGLQPLLVAIIRWINPWVHMIFMIIFYMQFAGDCIDGIAALFKYRRRRTLSKERE